MATIWHPFTQMKTAKAPIHIVRGKGTLLISENGKEYIDGISSWWVNLHGHAHPYIGERIAQQARELEHVIFAGFTHPPAQELTKQLLSILPGPMNKLFFSDNGSTAVEIGLKMALQYWFNRKVKKTKIVTFKGGYHGDTFGTMSAAGKNGFNRPFWDHMFETIQITPPLLNKEEQSINELRTILRKEDIACFLFEPLIQGVSGMVTHCRKSLDRLIALCNEYEVLTIADEVMTGFGRLDTLFASETLDKTPDIICLSKGITGGFLPLGVTACKEFIYRPFHSEKKEHALLHGHSYTANPIACASALANLDLLTSFPCKMQRKMIAKSHRAFVQKWEDHPHLKRCHSLGTILILEFKAEKEGYFSSQGDRLYEFFLERQILLRPLGNVLYVLPPYCITPKQLEIIYAALEQTLTDRL